MNINTQIKKLEEKDLELISGGKLKPKVKERIKKNSLSTVGYKAGQIIFSVIGGAVGALLSANVSYSHSYTEITKNNDGEIIRTKEIPGHLNKLGGTPALVVTTGTVGVIVGMKIWDEIANNIF